jgi:hypothetical protein
MAEKREVTFGWVVLRDPRTVKDRERKAILTAAADLGDDDLDAMVGRSRGERMSQGHDWENVFAATLIQEWSFAEPITPEGLAELSWVTRNDITELVAPLWGELFPKFEPDPAPDSPTEPSGA